VITLDAVVVNVALPSIRRDLAAASPASTLKAATTERLHRPEQQPGASISALGRACFEKGDANSMSDWTAEQLDKIGAADELEIAALRPDGSLRPATTIWVVRVGDDLYVRSYRGRRGAWFRSVLRRPEGRIRAGGVTRDVAFQEPDDADHDAIDQAYRAKYAHYGGSYVDPMVSPNATAATLRLIAR
jgi:hypothetical protein